jgi:hypothetical protein
MENSISIIDAFLRCVNCSRDLSYTGFCVLGPSRRTPPQDQTSRRRTCSSVFLISPGQPLSSSASKVAGGMIIPSKPGIEVSVQCMGTWTTHNIKPGIEASIRCINTCAASRLLRTYTSPRTHGLLRMHRFSRMQRFAGTYRSTSNASIPGE